MRTGNELVKESLGCKDVPDMLARAKGLSENEVFRFIISLWEQRKKGREIGIQIISISAAIAISGFMLAIGTAMVVGLLRLARIL